jgi:ADP-ribosylglycohydrolase
LEAALWCFLTTDSYREAVLKAVNLGDDTDTTAAVTGALTRLAYGVDAIPAEWLERLATSGDICRLAGAMAGALPA